jgi:hypothetical protein
MDNVRVLKEFKFNDKDYVVIAPSLGVIRESKYTYSRYFTTYLKEGFLTRKKMQSLMMDTTQSIYEDYINRRAELLQSMVEIENLMDKTETADDLENLANMLNTYRNMLLQEDTAITDIFNNTADQMAEDERINFLVLSLIRNKENNTKVWEKEEDFLNENNMEFVESCKYQVMCVEYGLNSDWDKELPEIRALNRAKKIREDDIKVKKEDFERELDEFVADNKKEEVVEEAVKSKKAKTRVKKDKQPTSKKPVNKRKIKNKTKES